MRFYAYSFAVRRLQCRRKTGRIRVSVGGFAFSVSRQLHLQNADQRIAVQDNGLEGVYFDISHKP
jgi:hypothetical protein